DVERRAVVGERDAVLVEDLAAHARQVALLDDVRHRARVVAVAAHHLELPEPADEKPEADEDAERHPAQPLVQLGQRRPVAAVAADHHGVRPSSAASRSRCVRAYAASMRRNSRHTIGPTIAVANAISASCCSSSPTGGRGMPNSTLMTIRDSDANSAMNAE